MPGTRKETHSWMKEGEEGNHARNQKRNSFKTKENVEGNHERNQRSNPRRAKKEKEGNHRRNKKRNPLMNERGGGNHDWNQKRIFFNQRE